MGKDCNKCQERNVGCDVIQQMNKDIWKLKNGKFWLPFLVGIFISLFLLVALFVVWNCFRSRQVEANPPFNVQMNVVKTQEVSKVDENIIEKALQETAQQAFYQGRKEAQEEYDKNFATLLTLLTIFGIAWPVIVGLLQFKFSEKEQGRMEKANDNAEESLKHAREANDNAEESLTQASEANKKADDSIKKVKSMQIVSSRVFSQQYYDMGCDKKKADASTFGIFNHYFALALEFKLRTFLLDERNIMVDSITHILGAFDISQPDSDENITCRNGLTTCKAIAGEVMRNAHGTVREKEAVKVWNAVVKKYNQFGGSPIDGEDD